MGMPLEFWNLRKGHQAAALVLLSSTLTTGVALAEDEEPVPREPGIATHGFVSQGYIKTTENNYLAETKGGGSFEFSEAGINVTAQVSERLRVGVQLFARDLGPIGNYDARFDWYNLDYRFADWLGFRAGRTKVPFGLYNETSDVDAARVPVLLPQSVYPTENRDYLLAQTGVELYGYVSLDRLGGLEYRAYGGTVFLDQSANPEVTDFSAPYVVGSRLMWLTPLDGLQVGGSLQALRLDGTIRPSPETLAVLEAQGSTIPDDFAGTVDFRIPAVLWIASAEYTYQNLQVAAEYSRWLLRLESTVPELVPEISPVNERYYAMASYHVTDWFTPGVYYAATFPDVEMRKGRAAYQHDFAATFRYDLTPNWLLKLEGHYMRGTAVLNPALNDYTPNASLRADWGALLVKTTAYF